MKKTPITIIGGYLGAGKTTLINSILTSPQPPKNLAVLVNDFGDINLDAQWIKEKTPDGKVIGLTNGCICCTIGDDLAQALENLRAQSDQIADASSVEHILLEASGVASPHKLKRQCTYPGYYPRAAFVLVDADNYEKYCLDKFVGYLVKQQVDEADYLILSKQDLAPTFKLETSQPVLVAQNPNIFSTAFDIHSSGPKKNVAPVETQTHAHGFNSSSLKQSKNLTLSELENLCRQLPKEVHRVKGHVQIEAQTYLLHRVQRRLAVEPIEQDARNSLTSNQLVFIYLDYAQQSVEHHLRLHWQHWQQV